MLKQCSGSVCRHYAVIRRTGIALVLACVALACSYSREDSKVLLRDAVTEFHRKLDSHQYREAYLESDTALTKSLTEAEFLRLLQTIGHKLGKTKASTLRSSQASWTFKEGFLISAVYDTEFTLGTGVEEFVWRVRGGRTALAGYHITSPTLVEARDTPAPVR
jgi:hypothetical protein